MKRILAILLAALFCWTLIPAVTLQTAEADGTHYRALLIGEVEFGFEVAERNRGDVTHMSEMLSTVTGPTGESFFVQERFNLGYSDIRSEIQTTFANTTEDDVSLFFIATHGDSDGDGDLYLTDGYSTSWLDFATLASWLSTYVKGKVIVVLESCGAGSAIYANNASDDAAAAQFTQRAVDAFKAYEKRTGELRSSKFYVLAAAAHHQMSWGSEGYDPGNYFTDWLVEGIGLEGSMPADTDGDGFVTLDELYRYIAQYNNYLFYDGYYYYTQQVQVYPENCAFKLFCRGGVLPIIPHWMSVDGKWYCYDDDENLLTGWQYLNEQWYYFDKTGVMQTGWQKIAGIHSHASLGEYTLSDWYYFLPGGSMVTGWKKLGDKWYYLREQDDDATSYPQHGKGSMAVGWTKLKDQWYYFASGGAMVTGWQKIGSKWYWFESGGKMVTGWKKLSNKWYYFDASGAMVTGWQKIGGKWYWFESGGQMATGWKKLNNIWYYFDASGAMATGWKKLNNVWYWFTSSGAMFCNGSKVINGKTYHFDASGACLNP